MLASALWRYVHDRALQQFQQSLLYALAAHVARNGHILTLAGNLVNLVDKDDTALRLVNVVAGILQQANERSLYVFAHIAGFGQGGSVHYGEGYLEKLGNRASEQRLARTGGTHQQDIALLDLHIVFVDLLQHALVMVINGYGQEALGFVLTDNVQIQKCLDLLRRRQRSHRQLFVAEAGFGSAHEKIMTGFDTVVTNQTAVQTGEQFRHLASAETAYFSFVLLAHILPLCVTLFWYIPCQ